MTMPTTKTINITRIKFPDIQLQTRDAHKLRGYFGNLFKAQSPLLHNHYQDGSLRYRYPLIQYKVINKTPMLIGIEEGAELLPQLFLKIKELDINAKKYPINSKNIETETVEIGTSNVLHTYEFKTLWMALNQANFEKYKSLDTVSEKQNMLNRILIGLLLGFYSNMDLKIEERLMVQVKIQEKTTNFKGHKMLAFSGSFVVNALLPNYIGLGKSSARGFGTICKTN